MKLSPRHDRLYGVAIYCILAVLPAVLGLHCTVELPQAIVTTRDTPVDIDVLAVFPGYSKVKVVSQGACGTASVNEDLKVRYSPGTGCEGLDQFFVRLTDGPRAFQQVSVRVIVQPPYVLSGCDFSPYQDGQDPSSGGTVTYQQLEKRLRIAATYCRWVRFYGLADDLLAGPFLAKKLGLKVAAGADLVGEGIPEGKAWNEEQIRRLIFAGKSGWADALVVGNETQYHNVMSEEALIGYMNQVREAVPGVHVTTAENDRFLLELLENPEFVANTDVIFANIHPFWDGVPVEYGAETAFQDFQEIVAKTPPEKKVVISEVGWRSSGEQHECAEPSLPNLRSFLLDLKACAQAQEFEFFYFELADEPWKEPHGDDGWGVFDRHWEMKPGMEDVFESDLGATDCSGGAFPGDPSIEITCVPGCEGLTECEGWVEGQVLGVGNTNDYSVFVYINVEGTYWIKPLWEDPNTHIWSDGIFKTDILKYPTDLLATEIVAFLVQKDGDYIPPEWYSPVPPPELAARVLAEDSEIRASCSPGG